MERLRTGGWVQAPLFQDNSWSTGGQAGLPKRGAAVPPIPARPRSIVLPQRRDVPRCYRRKLF